MFPHEEERKALEEKMKTSEAKEIFKLRKEIVEPVFGDISGRRYMYFDFQSDNNIFTNLRPYSTLNQLSDSLLSPRPVYTSQPFDFLSCPAI